MVKKGDKYVLDQSRQWPESLDELANTHRVRYKFAASRSVGRTLDAACGVGYGSYLIQKNVQTVGIDQSAPAIMWARKYFPGPEYICGDIEKAPWQGEFGTIVSLETIEHLKDPLPALKMFRKFGKKLIVSVPNQELYPFDAEKFKDDESPHFRHYTPEEFDALLSSAGFVVKERFCQEHKLAPNVVTGTEGKFIIYVCE